MNDHWQQRWDKIKPKVKPNYVPWNRGWTTVRRHLPVVIKPLIAATIITVLWRVFIYHSSWHINANSHEPVLFIVLPLVGFIYVIFASIAITTVFDQYKTLSKSVVRRDLDTFLVYRDEQLPILMHILISTPSLIIVGFVMLFDYQNSSLVGMVTVFVVSFVFMLNWVIATELDNFKKSIWFQQNIPPEWFEIDIEAYFAKEKHSS